MTITYDYYNISGQVLNTGSYTIKVASNVRSTTKIAELEYQVSIGTMSRTVYKDSKQVNDDTDGVSNVVHAFLSPQHVDLSATNTVALTPAGQLVDSAGTLVNTTNLANAATPNRSSLGLWVPGVANNNNQANVDRNTNIVLGVSGGVVFSTQSTITVTIATPGVVTDTAHGLTLNAPVTFFTTGALPTGLSPGTQYYVSSVVSANSYQVSATIGGTSINTTGTQSGVHTRVSSPNSMPAIQFNGAGYLQSDITTMTMLQKSIFNLSTLRTDEMFVFTTILTTPTSGLTKGCLFFWGLGSDNGWGIEVTSGGKLQFDHVPFAGTRDQFSLDSSFNILGDTADNSKTALCITITRAPSVADNGNYGQGAGLFEVHAAKIGLTNQGPFGQKNFQVATPARIPNTGTAVSSYSTVGLTLGMRPTTTASTVTDPLGSGYGMDNIIFQRRKRQGGLCIQVARQMAALYNTNPAVLAQPACLAL